MKIENHSKTIIRWIFTSIVGVFALYSFIATCYINPSEHVYYTYTTFTKFIMIPLVLCLFFLLFYHFKQLFLPILPIKRLLQIAFFLGAIYILCTQFPPKADQNACLVIAEQMHHNDYSAFAPGHYMQIYPQQSGLVLLLYVLGFLFGTHNVVLLQLLNVMAYCLFLLAIYKLTLRLFEIEAIASKTVVITMLFVPLLIYNSFVYGTMLGLALSTYAMAKAMDYMQSRSVKDGLLCILLCSSAVLVKKNFIIVLIAIFIIVAFHSLFQHHKRGFLFELCLLLCGFFFIKAPIATIEHMAHTSFEEPLPSMAWIAMGLQEGKRANGWFNEYSTDTYQDHGCDASITNEIAKKEVGRRLHQFITGEVSPVLFFSKKLASEWNEPSFECFHLSNYMSTLDQERSPVLFSIFRGNLHDFLLDYLDLFQSLIYLGALLCAWYDRKNISLYEMIPMLTFLGGFFFHTIWEAKGQYTLCYFVLLFPYAAMGYFYAFQTMERFLRYKEPWDVPRIARHFAPFSLLFLTYGAFTLLHNFIPSIQETIVTSNAEYQTYLHTPAKTPTYINGIYRLRAYESKEFLTFDQLPNETNLTAKLQKDEDDSQLISIEQSPSTTKLTISKYNQSMDSLSLPPVGIPATRHRLNIYNFSHTIQWSIIKTNRSTLIIRNSNGYALTRTNEGTIVFQPYKYNNLSQHWRI